MSLGDVIASVEGREKRLTVFDPPDRAVVDELREYFASQAVVVEEATADAGPSGYAVLSEDRDGGTGAPPGGRTGPDDGEVLAAVDLRVLEGDITARPGEPRPFSAILEHLDGTTFTSYSVRQMLAASREMEDRAWRAGTGRLHAGFQRPEALHAQRGVYEDLATKSDLDVHTYCASDEGRVEIEGVTSHRPDTREIRESWFVVFDGGGRRPAGARARSDDGGTDGGVAPAGACALLAEQRGDPDERRFYGFWTYDPGIVSTVLDHLTERYALAA